MNIVYNYWKYQTHIVFNYKYSSKSKINRWVPFLQKEDIAHDVNIKLANYTISILEMLSEA